MILGSGQLGNTDRVAPNHLGRNISWIIAGTENDDPGAGDLPQQTFEILRRSREVTQVCFREVTQAI